LTGLPFPRDSGLCTRFATQITFRRAPVKQVKVTILPAKDAIPEHVATVTAWQKNGFDDVNSKTFAIIMKEVCEFNIIPGASPDNQTQQLRAVTFCL